MLWQMDGMNRGTKCLGFCIGFPCEYVQFVSGFQQFPCEAKQVRLQPSGGDELLVDEANLHGYFLFTKACFFRVEVEFSLLMRGDGFLKPRARK
jgi:hypothetical protein